MFTKKLKISFFTISVLTLLAAFMVSCGKQENETTKKTDEKKTEQKQVKDTTAKKNTETFYATKNHEYWQNYPGMGPKGDVEMAPATDTAQVNKIKMSIMGESKQTVYTCEMHPEILQNYMGKCPKCKMDLMTMKDYKQMNGKEKTK